MNLSFDGEDVSHVLRGKASARRQDLFWEHGRDASYQRPGLHRDQNPNLALRSGQWKVLVNDDGKHLELYDLRREQKEKQNLAAAHPDIAQRLSSRLLDWRRSLPLL